MIAETLTAHEAEPEAWPAVSGLSDAAAALDPGPIWRRLEVWSAARFAARLVTFKVEGPGVWAVPFEPATLVEAERFASGWQVVQLDPHPERPGWRLEAGLYRIKAEVGGAPPPVALEAFRRLAEYLADDRFAAGVTISQESIGGPAGNASQHMHRPASWLARAIHYSGAADVLRPIRRAR